jgi:cytochrome c-type biogenesis protein CcmH/NrfG
LIAAAILAREESYAGVESRDAQARELLDRVLAREPKNARAHYMLGRRDMLDGKFASAEAHLRTALTSAPGDLPTQLALGGERPSTGAWTDRGCGAA